MRKSATKSGPHASSLTQVPAPDEGIAALRSETALSRFPLHKLSQSDILIRLEGHPKAVLWRVDGNIGYGEPGHLAYKIDTLHINRRIEESGRPVAKIIRLGSLREIGESIGCYSNPELKRALLQNASAMITAKISYIAQEGGEKSLEAIFNRYSVIFTNQMLPHGEKADAVHLILNDIYQEVLNSAVFRPLDYDYMKTLSPMSQRLYEIVSYQMFAAIKHSNGRAKISYSEYCLLSTAVRYFDFDHMKKQMYKVFKPHTSSGYIARIEYERTRDEQGREDWWMWLTPGPAAHREALAFSGQGKTRKPTSPRRSQRKQATSTGETPPTSTSVTVDAKTAGAGVLSTPQAAPVSLSSLSPVLAPVVLSPPASSSSSGAPDQTLVEQLVAAQLNRGDAERFARDVPDICRRQLAYLPFVAAFKTSQGAYLRRAIEGDFGPPAGFVAHAEEQEQRRGSKSRRAQERFATNEKKAREAHQERFYGLYSVFLKETLQKLEATRSQASTAFLEAEEEQRRNLTSGPFAHRPLTRAALEAFDVEENRLERARVFFAKQGVPLSDFWEWDSEVNPNPFRI